MLKQYVGDRPLTAFSLAAFRAGLSWVAIAAGVALVLGFSSVALAQVVESSEPVVTPPTVTPPTVDAPIAPVPPLGNAWTPVQDSSGLTPASENSENSVLPAPVGDGVSAGQINAQRPELPFSDVSPDHWVYEALLYLSTGERSPQASP
ncbi:MAG: hypothetical protein Fur0046_31680 [Cyanobacteria bacterium J069]|nr:MAG: hypothetical protein D6742_08810 [Cyanobacteria bacterium J069]